MTAPGIRAPHQRPHLALPAVRPVRPADRGERTGGAAMRAHGAIDDRDRHATVRGREPATLPVRRGVEARAIRQLRGITRAPQRHRSPSTLPLTHLGWAVVGIAGAFPVILTALVLLLHR
jgi:hypothetical protein